MTLNKRIDAKAGASAWERHRFKTDGEDYRPVKFPPPGPYWCTGNALDCSYSVVVACLPKGTKLTEWWPDAHDVETDDSPTGIKYSERFPKPQWWHGA